MQITCYAPRVATLQLISDVRQRARRAFPHFKLSHTQAATGRDDYGGGGYNCGSGGNGGYVGAGGDGDGACVVGGCGGGRWWF